MFLKCSIGRTCTNIFVFMQGVAQYDLTTSKAPKLMLLKNLHEDIKQPGVEWY